MDITIKEIRYQNLWKLVDEAKNNKSEVARRCNSTPAYIGDILRRVKTKSGKERGVGDDLARKLENGFGKPRGWMDVASKTFFDTKEEFASDTKVSVVGGEGNTGVPVWANIARALMKEQGVTQDELKSTFQVKSRGSVGHYLSGRREPSINQLMRLARYLGITTSQLIGEVGMDESDQIQEFSQLIKSLGQEERDLVMRILRAVCAD